MRIAVCDDDETAVSFLRELIETYPKQKLCADGYSSGEDLLRSGHVYDLIFLDIDMRGIDGIETARRIRVHDRKVKIVYVTSYKEYAGRAFSVHAFGYLLKPVKQEKLWKQIEECHALAGGRDAGGKAGGVFHRGRACEASGGCNLLF